MERIEDLLRLVLTPGIGCVTINRLLQEFGSSQSVFGASESELKRVKGIRKNQIEALAKSGNIDPRPELERAAESGVNLIAYDSAEYPEALKSTYDPPCLLYVRGQIKPADNAAVAIVGTRRVSRYGRDQSERFGSLLGRAGFCVTSGLARGVDTFAHRGALAAGGRTIAVVGSGLSHVYPEENRDLVAEIAENGAVISEFPMETQPSRENFPRRNRIIAGLSLGVLVVEAPLRSGALITSRHAMEMNREVFAIPGCIDHDNAAGCHKLIQDGAKLVTKLDDILEELDTAGLKSPQVQAISEPLPKPQAQQQGNLAFPQDADSNVEAKILSILSADPLHIDHICTMAEMPVHEVSSTLMILELKRQVSQKPGKFFIRT